MPGNRKDSEMSDSDILKYFADHVSADISDGRTKSAIALKRIRQGLKSEGKEALREVLVNVISLNLHVEKQLTDYLLQNSSLVDDSGNLVPAISKDLLKLRQNTLQYLKMLQSLDSNKGGSSEGADSIRDLLDD